MAVFAYPAKTQAKDEGAWLRGRRLLEKGVFIGALALMNRQFRSNTLREIATLGCSLLTFYRGKTNFGAVDFNRCFGIGQFLNYLPVLELDNVDAAPFLWLFLESFFQ